MQEGIFIICPACSEQILKAASKCIHCGSGIQSDYNYHQADKSGVKAKELPDYFIEIKQFIIISVLTLGIYHIFWFYRNWCFLKEETKSDIKPLLNTLCLFIPLYNFYMIYKCIKEINLLLKKSGGKGFKDYEAAYQYVFISIYAILPFIWKFLAILKFWPLIDVQKGINEYVMKKEANSLSL